MEIEINTGNAASMTVVNRRSRTVSINKNDASLNKSRSEESVKQLQEAHEEAGKNLEKELQLTEEQRQRIDAEKYLKEIIKITELFNRKLKYSIDKELDQVVVKVVDAETDKVIKEIPPDELKRLHAKMKEAIGSIIDTMI